jgi:hypothetical protein
MVFNATFNDISYIRFIPLFPFDDLSTTADSVSSKSTGAAEMLTTQLG